MISNIKAVIFDWAGTTIDFGSCAPLFVFVNAFKHKGIFVSPERVRQFMGLKKLDQLQKLINLPEVRSQWEEIYGSLPDSAQTLAFYRELEELMITTVKDYCEPIPGCLELIKTLRSMNIKIGSTTGYTKEIMDQIVPIAEKFGFSPDVYITSDEVPEARPAPYMVFLNAIKLEIYPLSVMVKVGDTQADILEGKMAGMWTVGLSKSGNELGYTVEELSKMNAYDVDMLNLEAKNKLLHYGADYVIDGIWDLYPILEDIDIRISNGETPC